jgi:hypothetical protein
VADRKKRPGHDDAWWAAQRHAYIEKNDILLSDYPSWEWVSPYDFWRTIFPDGFLQPRGEVVPWHERGGGHPNGIAIQITHKTKTVKTKTGIEHDVPVIERFTLTDDLDGVEERVVDSNRKNESVFCAPVSYFGKSRVAANARFLHAFAIDLDPPIVLGVSLDAPAALAEFLHEVIAVGLHERDRAARAEAEAKAQLAEANARVAELAGKLASLAERQQAIAATPWWRRGRMAMKLLGPGGE